MFLKGAFDEKLEWLLIMKGKSTYIDKRGDIRHRAYLVKTRS